MKRFGKQWSALLGGVALVATLVGCTQRAEISQLSLSPLPSIVEDEAYGCGLGSASCPVIDGELVLAGGANFPFTPQDFTTQKRYYNQIWALDEAGGVWQQVGEVPYPVAYAGNFALGNRLIVAGGSATGTTYQSVFSLSLNEGKAHCEMMPELPYPLEQAGAAWSGERLYLAGGLTAPGKTAGDVLVCDLANGGEWRVLTTIPEPMVQPILAASERYLYLWAGFDPVAKRSSSNGYRLDLATLTWTPCAPVPEEGTFVGATAFPADEEGLMVVGGVNRTNFNKGLVATGEALTEYLLMEAEEHNFNRKIWRFSFAEEAWRAMGEFKECALAAPAAARHENRLFVFSGEVKARVRTPLNWVIEME